MKSVDMHNRCCSKPTESERIALIKKTSLYI